MTATAGMTSRIADHIASLQWQALPASSQETTKRLLLDGIGCLLAGTRGIPGEIAARATGFLVGGAGHATILYNGARASARDAAFVNGITLYSVGVNDIHKSSGAHPGGCVIPALLAVGEWLDVPGPDMFAAMVAGYDVMGRLGRAMIPSHRERGFHPTGTFGAFGATAAVARMMGLNAASTCDALGIAGSQAAGLKAFQTDGSLTMIFHAGRSAQNGVEAALLAREGFSGPHSVFEDEQGFVRATSDVYRMEELGADLGSRFEVDDTSFRPYYGCTLTITSSGASAAVMKARPGRSAEDVVSITVRCSRAAEEEVGNDDPRTLLSARLSMQFNVALVVARGDVWVGDVDEHDLYDPRIRGLMARVVLEGSDSMPRYGSVVTIKFRDGSSDSAEMLSPKGDPQDPLSWDETRYKFMKLVEPLDNVNAAAHVADLVWDLEKSRGRALMTAINAVISRK